MNIKGNPFLKTCINIDYAFKYIQSHEKCRKAHEKHTKIQKKCNKTSLFLGDTFVTSSH